MAYNTRKRLGRKLDTCILKTDYVLQIMKDILDTYNEDYPDYREFAETVTYTTLQLQQLIKDVRKVMF